MQKKRGWVLFSLIFLLFGILLINFVFAKAVDSDSDGKISFREWLNNLFNPTGKSISSESSGRGDGSDNSDSEEGSSGSDSSGLKSSDEGFDNSDDGSAVNKDLSVSGGDDKKSGEKVSGDSETKETKTETREMIIDEQGREVEVRINSEIKEGELKTEEKRTFVDENGNKITIITETETKNGETETIFKRKITTPAGVEITFKTKTKIEEGKERITNSIEVKGAVVETKLSVREEIREGIPRLKAELSTGAEQEIIILPDEALRIAFDELQTTEGFVFEVNEIVDENTRKAVFSAKAIQPGKFLGIFNTNVNLETLIDTQTGEIIKTEKPWWAFLVVGQDEATVCHITSENRRATTNVLITEVKDHLIHGDNIGECSATCGDGIIVEEVEICESENTQTCTTTEGYAGSQICNNACTGYNECITTESCGDGIINGLEMCDDGNILNEDSCNNLCQIEQVTTAVQ